MFSKTLIVLAVLAFSASSTIATGFIQSVDGANGAKATGFGVQSDATKNSNTGLRSSSVFTDANKNCGKVANRAVNVPQSLAALEKTGVPTAKADGTVTGSFYRVSIDRLGPLKFSVDPSGKGESFSNTGVTVVTNANPAAGKAANFAIKLDPSIGCKGGAAGNVCIVRAEEQNGPFGSCFAVAVGGGAGPGAGGATGGAPKKTKN